MYHEINDETVTQDKMAVTPEVFGEQLAYLREAGFTSLTAGQLAEILTRGGAGLPARPVVLTFDDGYGDFYDHALPLLKQHELTGTLFQTTGWVGLTDKVKRMMNWRELAEVAGCGIEVGAHTYCHPQLDQLSDKDLREELTSPKHLIEDKLGMEVPGLAYPYGYSNAKVRRVTRETGYAYAYSVSNALTTSGANRFALPRLTVGRLTTMEDFGRLVNGQDTPALRRARVLTKGYTPVRRARSMAARMTGRYAELAAE
jgi:peptidoglycan/xylan/chitin deacetylase (PgdA/CDA1 family)